MAEAVTAGIQRPTSQGWRAPSCPFIMAAIGAAVSVGIVLTAWKGKISWPVAAVAAGGATVATASLLGGRWLCIRRPTASSVVAPSEPALVTAEQRKAPVAAEPIRAPVQQPAPVTQPVLAPEERGEPPVHLKTYADVTSWLRDPTGSLLWIREWHSEGMAPKQWGPEPTGQDEEPENGTRLKRLVEDDHRNEFAVILVSRANGTLWKWHTERSSMTPQERDKDEGRAGWYSFVLVSLDGTQRELVDNREESLTIIGVRKA
jgi:hypothetical protein